jgi:hypothetical protein
MNDTNKISLLAILDHYFMIDQREKIPFGDIVKVLHERAFGLTLLFLALPNVLGLTTIPGISTIFGIPVCIISVQMIIGYRYLKLPEKIQQKTLKRHDCLTFIERSRPYLTAMERFLKPRLAWINNGFGERITGIFCLVLGVIITLPIVFGNFFGGLALAFIALGLIEDDGLFSLIGYSICIILLFVIISFLRYIFEFLWYFF